MKNFNAKTQRREGAKILKNGILQNWNCYEVDCEFFPLRLCAFAPLRLCVKK
jgi:hypothetical protein